jgi:hypothetical protein
VRWAVRGRSAACQLAGSLTHVRALLGCAPLRAQAAKWIPGTVASCKAAKHKKKSDADADADEPALKLAAAADDDDR